MPDSQTTPLPGTAATSDSPAPANRRAVGPATVGVVMPVRDGADYVEEALRSVLAQTHPIAQIVVVDDGSGDDTVARIRRVAGGDPRLLLLEGGGRGVARATNLGFDHLHTEYAAIQHQDDRWDPDKIAVQLRAMAPGVALVACRMRYMGPTGKVRGTTPYGPLTDQQRADVRRGAYSVCLPSTFLVRTADAVRVRFPLDFMPSDLHFVHALAAEGEIVVLPEPLADYRLHPGASTVAKYARARMAVGYFPAREQAQAEGRELSFAEYMAARRPTLNERRVYAAGLWGRRAATHALCDDRLRALGSGAVAAALAPVTTARGVLRLQPRAGGVH